MTTLDDRSATLDRLARVRWCACGDPWIPPRDGSATECRACALQRLLDLERERARGARPGIVKARGEAAACAREAFLWVVQECQRYAEEHPEHAEAAQQIAVRVHQEARRG